MCRDELFAAHGVERWGIDEVDFSFVLWGVGARKERRRLSGSLCFERTWRKGGRVCEMMVDHK